MTGDPNANLDYSDMCAAYAKEDAHQLQKAIAHCDELGDGDTKCAEEHRQLGWWLRELVMLRQEREEHRLLAEQLLRNLLKEAARANFIEWLDDHGLTKEEYDHAKKWLEVRLGFELYL